MDMYENIWRMTDKEDDVEVGEDGEKVVKQGVVDNDKETSTVIGMMTTTETKTLPDGTVYTKRVLKKRFSDGREESREEVSTSRDDGGGGGDKTDAEERDKKTGSGWFWS